MSRKKTRPPATQRERELTAVLLAISVQAQNATSAVDDGTACFNLLAQTVRQIAAESTHVLATPNDTEVQP